MLLYTAGYFDSRRCSIKLFVGINVRLVNTDPWMRRTSKSKGNGVIFIVPLILLARRLIFLLTADRDTAAALRFFRKALRQHGEPTLVTIDKSGANTAALVVLNTEKSKSEAIKIQQNKSLNNLIEQDHRNIKRRIWPMLGFKSFHRAQTILAGIELVSMLRKGQYRQSEDKGVSPAEMFYLLAA
ncbi:hypothetical protein XBI1_3010012 [Xenorhabdus bovienii str. Intermedium]|uniref:DDE domain-containing protein n=1 Tax=Xenorhabdus bovienii str. Intermedium TaxID=1379677 RepID=A0A077QLU8_XENBV|nr:hypothetical protein XBI1_3010012 [Xenorhabdus bovienii str. Intermedium]